MCAEVADNIKDFPAVLSLTLALSREEREPSGGRFRLTPLPCAMRDLTQKINRKRNVR